LDSLQSGRIRTNSRIVEKLPAMVMECA
jgi:hypothetical protein